MQLVLLAACAFFRCEDHFACPLPVLTVCLHGLEREAGLVLGLRKPGSGCHQGNRPSFGYLILVWNAKDAPLHRRGVKSSFVPRL